MGKKDAAGRDYNESIPLLPWTPQSASADDKVDIIVC